MARFARSLLLTCGAVAALALATRAHLARPAQLADVASGAPSTTAADPSASALPATATTPEQSTPFTELAALEVGSLSTRQAQSLRLYDALGNVNEAAAAQLDELLADTRDPKQPATLKIERRLLQLLFRAAYHFHSAKAEIVSGYRKPRRRREGPHGLGHAVDFKLQGVEAKALAAYLRTLSRVGVGIYTHPRTQYVHLDVRAESYHWIDASPPRRHWRERSLRTPDLPAHDRAYAPAQDWPEGLVRQPTQDVAHGPQ